MGPNAFTRCNYPRRGKCYQGEEVITDEGSWKSHLARCDVFCHSLIDIALSSHLQPGVVAYAYSMLHNDVSGVAYCCATSHALGVTEIATRSLRSSINTQALYTMGGRGSFQRS